MSTNVLVNSLSSPSSSLAARSRPDDTRPLANFHPSPWGDYFLHFVPDDEIIYTKMKKEARDLEQAVKEKLSQLAVASDKLEELIDFIYAIERLGVAYRIEEEIEQGMQTIQGANDAQLNLYHTSVRFLLLRRHGLYVSCEVFSQFQDESGRFKDSLASDVKGMMSLYEASFVAKHGDYIMEEARAFTTSHLKLVVAESNHPQSAQVSHALYQPWHRGMPRLESRFFISYYEDEPSHDKEILTFAKLDFNLVQAQLKIELRDMTRWWKDLDLVSKMPFARNRLVECYFWALGMSYEPEHALARKIFVQVEKLTSVVDDIYDAYGTLEELTIFTKAIEKWDINSANALPIYMQHYYKALIDTFEGFERDLSQIDRTQYVKYVKEQMITLCRLYYLEAKWCHERHTPTFDEYMNKVAIGTSGIKLLLVAFYLGLKECDEKAFKWVRQDPQFLRDACIITRLVDDVVGHTYEQQRNHVPSAVENYMRQFEVTEEKACKELIKQVEYCWSDINERMIKPCVMPKQLLTSILNEARIIDVLYKGEDNYTISNTTTKNNISVILINPIPI